MEPNGWNTRSLETIRKALRGRVRNELEASRLDSWSKNLTRRFTLRWS